MQTAPTTRVFRVYWQSVNCTCVPHSTVYFQQLQANRQTSIKMYLRDTYYTNEPTQTHTHTVRQLCGRVNVRINLLSTLTPTPTPTSTSLLTASAKRFGCGCGSGSVDEPSSWPKDAQPATIVCARNSTGATSVLSACNTKWQALFKLCLDSSVYLMDSCKGKRKKRKAKLSESEDASTSL